MNTDYFCSSRIAVTPRREALKRRSAGFGYVAFAGLLAEAAERSSPAQASGTGQRRSLLAPASRIFARERNA